MATKKLALLGSTGSIGTQTLEVVRGLDIEITALAAHSNAALLEKQALEFRPRTVALVDPEAADALRSRLEPEGIRVLSGSEALVEIAACDEADTLLGAVVGTAGLEPTLAAIEAGKTIALANKETLVAAGQLVIERSREKGVDILPVDSEHSAIFQCLQCTPNALRRIFLTASGGPFYGMSRDRLAEISVEEALKHPNWSMGRKITVDSATLMNKGLELIEAMWLFSLPCEDIVITVHRQSIVHSMVEFCDCSVIAQLGLPDMRLPIQYALTFPERRPSPCSPLTIEAMSTLTFDTADEDTFRCLAAAKIAATRGGLLPAAVNAANERAVELFLERRISFLDIGDIVFEVADGGRFDGRCGSLADILAVDREAREYVDARVG